MDALREKSLGLPALPGVYVMLDSGRDVIYVGKAKNLKSRVSSYFHGDHDLKTSAMISKIADFDVIISGSEFEALLLENSLIKHHSPKYNILLRDDKGYPFIRVDTREEYPTFSVTSKPAKDGARYFGPFGYRHRTFEAVSAMQKALRLPTCSRKFPRDVGKERPCLNHHMGACAAYCLPGTPRSLHTEAIESAIALLDGKTADVKARLEADMSKAADDLRFELAAELRDRLRAIQQLESKQLVVSGASADADYIGYHAGPAKSCFTVLHYIGGTLLDKDAELFDTPIEKPGDAVSELLRQYYTKRGVVPPDVYLPVWPQDAELIEQLLTESSGRRIRLRHPRRGEKRRLVETANVNAREEAQLAATREEKTLKTLQWLQKSLGLRSSPERIEAFDISNTGSSDIVASMTVFRRGKPLRRDYRRFKIKTLDAQDDYHSMTEAVSRRAGRFIAGDAGFSDLPDVMFVDGGASHARAARDALANAGVALPVFGMVKDDRHRTRALVSPDGGEIGIFSNPAAFAFVGAIQEETHRFAVEYHRSLRSKSVTRSVLDGISGIGDKRRKTLMRAFGSVKAIRAASLDALRGVVPANAAVSVYEFFHPDADESREDVGGEAPGTIP
ncbi:MAG: excinuclease ABC subunit UvrC [Oscillospiraceae bacterium]|jgi:excinuclease ABC subunit C|nr:excinuclease ABC subunit UvrC [Oscillospiraceae bacterium]